MTSVKVAVRIRPMAAKELLANSKDCLELIPGTNQILVTPQSTTIYSPHHKSFTFDYLFDESSGQMDVYHLSVLPLVEVREVVVVSSSYIL
jgi:hypothetical protein